MTIADKIYELRSSRNMSLREFAKIAGVTHTTIARLEADTYSTQKVYLDTLYQICTNLNYDFNQFLIETGYLKYFGTQKASNEIYSFEERQLIEDYRELNQSGKHLINETMKTLLATSGGSEQEKNRH